MPRADLPRGRRPGRPRDQCRFMPHMRQVPLGWIGTPGTIGQVPGSSGVAPGTKDRHPTQRRSLGLTSTYLASAGVSARAWDGRSPSSPPALPAATAAHHDDQERREREGFSGQADAEKTSYEISVTATDFMSNTFELTAPAGEAIERYVPDVLGADRDVYAGKQTLVIGAGYSAVTTVKSLEALAAREEGTRVFWLMRSEESPYDLIDNDPLPQRSELAEFGNAASKGLQPNVSPLLGSYLYAIKPTGEGRWKVEIQDGFSIASFIAHNEGVSQAFKRCC